MVTFRGNLTDPPKVSTSDLSGTVKGWVGYVVVAAMALVAFGVAQNVLTPMLSNVLGMVGINSGEGGIQIGTSGGGL